MPPGGWLVWCFLSSRLSDKEAKFVKAGSSPLSTLKATLRGFEEDNNPPKFFCINDETDAGKGRGRDGSRYVYEKFLPERFPTKSQWETYACGAV